MNQDYYVFRDLVMSERTYLKDFELMRNASVSRCLCDQKLISVIFHTVVQERCLQGAIPVGRDALIVALRFRATD